MKRFFRSYLTAVAYLLSWLYPYTIIQYAKILFFYKIYSFAIQRQFKYSGTNFSAEPPLILNGTKYISVGDNVSIRGRSWIAAYDTYFGYHYTPELLIGNHVVINFNCHIACINSIDIGDHTLISSDVLITDHTHGSTAEYALKKNRRTEPLVSKGAVSIGRNVWIGEKVSILPGVCIGDNSIIGANSVVTKNIPENCIAVGNPATIIRSFL